MTGIRFPSVKNVYSFVIFFPFILLLSPQSLIYEKNKNKKRENERRITIVLTTKIKREMGKIVEGIKIAAYVAEVVVAGSVVIELVSKWNERRKLKSAVRVKAAAEEVAETD